MKQTLGHRLALVSPAMGHRGTCPPGANARKFCRPYARWLSLLDCHHELRNPCATRPCPLEQNSGDATVNWHHDLWPWMTLNSPSSSSSKLQVKYLKKNGDRYDVEVNRSRIKSSPNSFKDVLTQRSRHAHSVEQLDSFVWCSYGDLPIIKTK